MSRIFISYKRVDKDKVFKIKDQIESALGEKCWIDLDGIESDAQFANVIINAINSCEVFLFMYSTTHTQIDDYINDWTIRELQYALKQKKQVLLLSIDGKELTDWFRFMFPSKKLYDVTNIEYTKNVIDRIGDYLLSNNTDFSKSPVTHSILDSTQNVTIGSTPKSKSITKYDIFISYRRDGGQQYARILQMALAQRGYKVFLDYDELSDGIFGKKIKAAIIEAPIFILILSKGALERCKSENDWVRNEILFAISQSKYIININPDDTFDGIPEDIPDEIKYTIGSLQNSKIRFGSTQDTCVDFLVTHRIIPVLGARKSLNSTNDTNIQERKDSNESILHKLFKFISRTKTNETELLIKEYLPQKVDYDIFISYRREDGRDVARNIQQALKGRGHKRVFFDYDSIQKGEFTNRIIDAIYSCSDFVLVLSPKSMKRCTKSGDPVANEIRTACKYHKNIIPVTIDGKAIKWPRNFPEDLAFIKGLQFHDHKSDSYFEDSIERLCEKLTKKE